MPRSGHYSPFVIIKLYSLITKEQVIKRDLSLPSCSQLSATTYLPTMKMKTRLLNDVLFAIMSIVR